jgi:hypothetical protein
MFQKEKVNHEKPYKKFNSFLSPLDVERITMQLNRK